MPDFERESRTQLPFWVVHYAAFVLQSRHCMYWHVHTNLIGIFFHIFFMSTKILFTEIASYLSFIFNFWSNGEKNDGHVLHYIVLFHFFLVGYCKFQYFFSILQNTTDCYSNEGNYKLWEKTTLEWLDRLLWRTNTHILYLVRVLWSYCTYAISRNVRLHSVIQKKRIIEKMTDIEIAEFIYIFECQMSRVQDGNSFVKWIDLYIQ